MANEIQTSYDTGYTLYALVFNAAGQVWQLTTNAFVAYVAANINNYDIVMSEIATASGQYRGTFDSDISIGVYSVVLFEQTGGSPVVADDQRIGDTGIMNWDGSAEIVLQSPVNYKADVSNLDVAVSTRSSHSAADAGTDAASKVLVTPAQKLKTDVSGDVTAENMRGTDGANTTVPDAAGTAAGLHSTTDGKVDAVQSDATAIKASTDNLPADPASVANQTTILARMGTWTGTGINNILGAFKALLSKTASAPSDIGGTFDPTTDSVEAIRDRGDASWGNQIVLGSVVGSRNPANLVGSPLSLEIFRNQAKTFLLTVQDSAGDPVDLSGMTLRFVVQTTADTPLGVFKVDEPTITVTGDNNEIASVPVSETLSDITETDYQWRLWDTVTKNVLLYGKLTVLKALDDVSP